MIFRVYKKLTWDGITYEIGDAISIEEGHPRLEAIVELTHHVAYDSSLEEEDVQTTLEQRAPFDIRTSR